MKLIKSTKFLIIPKNKRLCKSSHVREWLRISNEIINRKLQEQNAQSKIAESIALGVPLMVWGDGKIKVIKDFYKKIKKRKK